MTLLVLPVTPCDTFVLQVPLFLISHNILHVFKVYNVVSFHYVFTMNHHHSQDNEYINTHQRILAIIPTQLSLTLPLLQATTSRFSVTIDWLLCSRILYNWNNAVCMLSCLNSTTQHNDVNIHPFCSIYQ